MPYPATAGAGGVPGVWPCPKCGDGGQSGSDGREVTGREVTGREVTPVTWIDATLEPSPARAEAFRRGQYGELMPDAEHHDQAWLLDRQGVMAMLGIQGKFTCIYWPRELLLVETSSFPDQANGPTVET